MGSAVIARCAGGLEELITIGGGMATFQTSCLFPAACRTCETVVRINLLDAVPRCPTCECKTVVPYSDSRLIGLPGSRNVFSWTLPNGTKVALTDGTYKCPHCGKTELRFSDAGIHWD